MRTLVYRPRCGCSAAADWARAARPKPIRFVIPFGSGSANDTLARVIDQELGQSMDPPVIVSRAR
jgi:tripartite-type tricarboxylate transporter receptor subunit TctC